MDGLFIPEEWNNCLPEYPSMEDDSSGIAIYPSLALCGLNPLDTNYSEYPGMLAYPPPEFHLMNNYENRALTESYARATQNLEQPAPQITWSESDMFGLTMPTKRSSTASVEEKLFAAKDQFGHLCHQCSSTFLDHTHYKRHKKVCKAQNNTLITCDECNWVGVKQNTYKMHKNRKHPKPNQPPKEKTANSATRLQEDFMKDWKSKFEARKMLQLLRGCND